MMRLRLVDQAQTRDEALLAFRAEMERQRRRERLEAIGIAVGVGVALIVAAVAAWMEVCG